MKALIVALLLCGGLLAQQPQHGPLTNQGVGGSVLAGVPESEVIRVITTAPQVSFDLRPVSTDALSKVGVSEDIIKVMAARQIGGVAAIAPDAKSAPPPSAPLNPSSMRDRSPSRDGQ